MISPPLNKFEANSPLLFCIRQTTRNNHSISPFSLAFSYSSSKTLLQLFFSSVYSSPPDTPLRMSQHTVPIRSIISDFYTNLLKIDTRSLNTLPVKDHAKWARRLIDAERNRRKSYGDTVPTKAERAKIISFGEGKKVNNATTMTVQDGPSAGNTSAGTKFIKKNKSPARTEVDGESLHEHVANSLDYHVSYNKNAYDMPQERSLAVFGTFRCPRPTCRKPWASGICTTVLEFSRSSMTYRTTIHSQKCRTCGLFAEPTLDLESYASKVKWVLDLWTGNREVVEPNQRNGPKGPHEEGLCHACHIGKCAWQKRE